MTTQATDKQLRYAAKLAADLRLGDEWDLIAKAKGWSRSKAQRKADMGSVSESIDWALVRLAQVERRAKLPEGDIDEGCVLLGGVWYQLTPETMSLYRARVGQLNLARLVARRDERKAAGLTGPWVADAIQEQLAAGPQPTAREAAIAQIRNLMAAHGITTTDL